MTEDDPRCPECARLEKLSAIAAKEKAQARLLFDAQYTVAGAQDRALRYREAVAAHEKALADLTKHKASHTSS